MFTEILPFFRKHEIRKFRKWGYKRWRKTREYGDRLAVEGENSGVKRLFQRAWKHSAK